MKTKFSVYQISMILVIVPTFYTIRNHFQIIPSIKALLPIWIINISNNNMFTAAWLSILVLQWISLSLVLISLEMNNSQLPDIGYSLNLKQTLLFILGLVFTGIIFYILKTKTNVCFNTLVSKSLPPVLFSKGEYLAWIFIAINAGFCEEIVYRGFGINAFRTWGVPKLFCLILPLISWISIHNFDTFSSMVFGIVFLVVNGLIFTGLYLWRQNLNVSIGLHAIADLLIILI